MKPEYKDLDDIGYPGYRVGSDGSVWSYKCKQGTRIKRWKELKPWNVQGKNNSQPYKMTRLTINGKKHVISVHRLVLTAFVGSQPKNMEACHINDVGIDNRLENLKWATHKENMKDRTNKGVHFKNTGRGSTHGCAKLNEKDVLKIRKESKRGTQNILLSELFQVTPTTICDIIKRRTWRHI